MANLLSYFLERTNAATASQSSSSVKRDSGNDTSHHPFSPLTKRAHLATNYNEAAVQKRIVDRYRAGRSNGLCGQPQEGYDLHIFKKDMLGQQVAEGLNKNYRTLLSRRNKITPWRVAHVSDLADASTQEVQLLPYWWAVDAQIADMSGVNRVLGYGGPLGGAGIQPLAPAPLQLPRPLQTEPPILYRYGDNDGDDNNDDNDIFYDTLSMNPQASPRFTTSTPACRDADGEDEDGEDALLPPPLCLPETPSTEGASPSGLMSFLVPQRFLVPDESVSDPYNTRAALIGLFATDAVPDYVQRFVHWLASSENARQVLDEANLTVQTSPTVGSIFRHGSDTGDSLRVFLRAMLDESKKTLPYLHVSGHFVDFENWFQSVGRDDATYDADFQPHLKFLVGKYNSEVSGDQVFVLRHSENPTRIQTSQSEYDVDPTEYDRLSAHDDEFQQTFMLKASFAKPFCPRLRVCDSP